REPQRRGGPGELRQDREWRGIDAQEVEMMLADPGRMQAHLLGKQRLVVDVLDEVLGRARIVGIAIVAEREVAEVHRSLPEAAIMHQPHLFANANKSVATPPSARPRPGTS